MPLFEETSKVGCQQGIRSTPTTVNCFIVVAATKATGSAALWVGV
ncbi:hypothetical protein [Streptomyces sp. NPDC016845]